MTAVRVLVTGSRGFLGRNLVVTLSARPDVSVAEWHRGRSEQELTELVGEVDIVFHLAGVNRPQDPAEFVTGNVDLTRRLVELTTATSRSVPIVLASSIQATRDNPYGRSKREAEALVTDAANSRGVPSRIYRLPNVFGKWSRPNYNSAVATFCHHTVHGLPIEVHDPAAPLSLVYVDDVCAAFAADIAATVGHTGEPVMATVEPVYETTVGYVADTIREFGRLHGTPVVGRVGQGLERALYATYLSFLPPARFSYPVTRHADPRGEFAEVIRTADSGQMSYFTAHPGVTRGGHYHHTKNERFLVLRGKARFRFENIATGETTALETSGETPEVVETVPGWAHDITNVGSDEMLVMLWANESFDPHKPDTVARKLEG